MERKGYKTSWNYYSLTICLVLLRLSECTIIEGPSNVTYLPGHTPLPIELTCNVTGFAYWRINGIAYLINELTNGALPGHNATGTNILVNSPVNNSQYICASLTNNVETRSNPAYIIIAVLKGPGIVIVHPGQDIELLCTVTPSGSRTAAWIINFVVYTLQLLHNGLLAGYSSNGNNLIIENIMMNDDRNDTEYSCVTVPSTVSNPTVADIVDESDPTILYVAGVPRMVPDVIVDNDTITASRNNVTLTLSWGEPFNNLDPIVNYTVSCSGNVTCPPSFTTTDNTTRIYTITNLTPMTTYTFSVVATNSIGSGEAGEVNVTTPAVIGQVSGVMLTCEPLGVSNQCTAVWNPVTQGDITGYQVRYYNSGMIVDANSSTTTLTFTAPSLPDGVFTGTVVVMVTAFSRYGIGPTSDPANATVTASSVTNAVAILNAPNATNELHSITVNCTIHPDSTADQCVVMAMDDVGRVRTGRAPITGRMAIVTVNSLHCGVTYNITARGMLNNGTLVGPGSSYGNITTGICPLAANCESDDELSTGAVVAISMVVTFIITLVVTALISIIITSMYYKRRHELKQDKAELVDVKNVNTEQKDPHHNPSYENVILKECTPDYALPTSTIKINTNPAYGDPSTIKMDANPAYALSNM